MAQYYALLALKLIKHSPPIKQFIKQKNVFLI
jgi:hypothetical protein